MRKIFIIGLILMFCCFGMVSAAVEKQKEMDFHLWKTFPCVDNPIQVNQNLNIQPYVIIWGVYSTYGVFSNTYWPSFDNVTIKAVYTNDSGALLQDTGWLNLSKPGWIWGVNNQRMQTLDFFGATIATYSQSDLNKMTFATAWRTYAWSYYFQSGLLLYPYEAGYATNRFLNLTYGLNETGIHHVKIYARDAQNVTMPWATALINFTVVSSGGVRVGDCNSSSLTTLGEVKGEDLLTGLLGQNKVMWYVILMVVVGVGLAIVGGLYIKNVTATIFIVALAELLMLFIGTYLHIIPVIAMLLLGLIVAGVGVIIVRKIFNN